MKRRLRVLMTADTIGGVWNYALELARALVSHRIDIALATMGGIPNKQQRAELAMIPNIALYASEHKLEWMSDSWRDVQAAGAWLLKLEADFQPDLVHLNGFIHAALPWSVPCLVVGHSCVCSWFTAVRGTPPPPQWNEYRKRVREGLRSAQLVTAPSAVMLDALTNHYGSFVAAGVVYNGRNAANYPPGAKEPFALTAGRLWDEAKNVSVLQKVARKLSLPIYAAGEDRGPEGNQADIDGLLLLGALDPPSFDAWLARAAIFVLPARYEPFGLAVLEAALARCALVLGDIPSFREIWDDAALFICPNDPDGIAAALEKLIQDHSLRRDLAAKAHRRALCFTPERMARGYLELYQKLVCSPGEKVQASL